MKEKNQIRWGSAGQAVGEDGWLTGGTFLRKELRERLGVDLAEREIEELKVFYCSLGLECCRFAIETAVAQKKYFWAYVRGILRNFEVRRMRERKAAEAQAQKGSRDYGRAPGYGNGGQISRPDSNSRLREDRREQMFQTHERTTVTPLERLAIESALREEYGKHWKEICNHVYEE